MQYNPLIDTDSYKASHYLQYPPGTKYVSSYIESRGGKFPATLFFGLQVELTMMREWAFEKAHIDDAEMFWKAHGLPFNREGFEYILDKYDGHWPVSVDQLREKFSL